MSDYKQTKIWKKFKSQSDHEDFIFVDNIVKDSIPILQKFSIAFPKYTDHSGVHQENILKLIGELLGDRLKDLTTLECAILILCTYLHDIGMAFTETELANLTSEPRFYLFLIENSKANRIFQENNKILKSDLAEWYCRWNHAFRVHGYLEKCERIDANSLKYKSISLREQIGLVCESHNWSAKDIKNDEKFVTEFLSGKADLRFCAILLRLADYLDFDDSRASKSLFDFLELNNPKSYNEEVSQREWLKHQASIDFTFSETARNLYYDINYLASPNDISIEHEIRAFVVGIEKELEECSKLIPYCSNRWQNFKLPNSIKKEIHSQGYKYGDFKFSLDQNQVLGLLMGENLYNSRHVFIRELLQNAIDTSRHREFEERSNHNTSFKAEPIQITMWEDEEGYRWIRFDDFGMGMDEKIIINFLLNVGTSYYNSDDFKVEQYKFQSKGFDFTPISRFGIGILSCFIIGDKIEINSLKKGASPVRLSVNGLLNYFTLQTGTNIPKAMPHERKLELNYRQEIGTSIAVRLDPAKETTKLDIKEILAEWLFFPPIPVQFKANKIGGNFEDLDKVLCEEFTEWLSNDQLKEAEDFMDMKFPNGLGITIKPYNISGQSYYKHLLKGQAIVLHLTNFVNELFYPKRIEISNANERDSTLFAKIGIKLSNEFLKEDGKSKETKSKHFELKKLGELLEKIEVESNYKFNIRNRSINSLFLSHNGIKIQEIGIENQFINKEGIFILGFIALFDKLRPEISTSRDKITKLSWDIDNQINFALHEFKKLGARNGSSIISYGRYIYDLIEESENIVSNYKHNELIQNEKGWLSKELFHFENEKWGWSEMEQFFKEKKQFSCFQYDFRLSNYFLHKLNVVLDVQFEKPSPWLLDNSNWSDDNRLDIFKPLYFIPFKNTTIFYFKHHKNLNHPISQWFINAGKYLKSEYPAIFKNIMDNFAILYDTKKRVNTISSINLILERIRSLKYFNEEFKPKVELLLTDKDII